MKAFIFDMDGVIVDSEPLHSRTKLATFRHYGLDFDAAELVHYMGRTSRALFGDVVRRENRPELDIRAMIDYKHALYLDILRHDEAVQPVDGTRRLFAALAAAHIPAGLASSAGRVVIEAVLEKFGGGPVGLDNVAAAIGESTDTIEDVIEPYLIQQGYLQRTPRGRMATALAWTHFGFVPPERV